MCAKSSNDFCKQNLAADSIEVTLISAAAAAITAALAQTCVSPNGTSSQVCMCITWQIANKNRREQQQQT